MGNCISVGSFTRFRVLLFGFVPDPPILVERPVSVNADENPVPVAVLFKKSRREAELEDRLFGTDGSLYQSAVEKGQVPLPEWLAGCLSQRYLIPS